MKAILPVTLFIAVFFFFLSPRLYAVNPLLSSSITTTPAIGNITACQGTASANPDIQQFTVSGSSLTGNIIAVAPASFEISLSANSGYSGSVTLSQSGEVVANTIIYVRSSASAPAGALSGSVTLTSTGAANQSVQVSGLVNPLATITQPANQIVNNGQSTPAINYTGTGNTFSWTNDSPSIGLASSGTGNIASFKAVNTSNSSVTATITATPKADPYVYVAGGGSNSVAVVDVATNSVVSFIKTDKYPERIKLSSDGSKAYVACSVSKCIDVINTATNTVVETIPVGNQPYGLVLGADGSKLYVANEADNSISIINTTNDAVINTIKNMVVLPGALAISPDGSKLAVSEDQSTVAIINTADNSFIKRITVSPQSTGITFNKDGSFLYVCGSVNSTKDITVIRMSDYSVIKTLPYHVEVYLLLSRDGSVIYATEPLVSQVDIISTTTNAFVGTIKANNARYQEIAQSADGKYLYVVNQNNASLTIIDLSNNNAVSNIYIGTDIYGLAYKPASACPGIPVSFTITVRGANVVPSVTATAVKGNISACLGTASVSPDIESFDVSGNNLEANITATAPTGFEVSLDPVTGYAGSVSIPQSGGNVTSATVYVRSSASAPAGNISGKVTLTSAGTANQVVAVTGVVNALPTVNQPGNQTIISGDLTTAVNFTGTGNAFTWTNDTPSIGLTASGSGNIPGFTGINNGSTPVTATVTVTPALGGYLYMANTVNNTLEVINTQTGTIVANIPTQKYPIGVSVSPDASRVYVSDENPGFQGSVSVINTSTNSVIATIPVDVDAWGIVTSPDGKWVYVANELSGTVSVINTSTNKLYTTISIPMGAVGIAVSPDGSRVYVAASYLADNYVVVINTSTNKVIKNIPVGNSPWGLAVSPDGSRVYVGNAGANTVSVINTSINEVMATIPVGNFPTGVVVNPDNSKVYVINSHGNSVSVIDVATNKVITNIPTGQNPEGISISPDGKYLYVDDTNSHSVAVFDTQTNLLVNTVSIGQTGVSETIGNFVTPGSGCTGISKTFTITVNPRPVVPTITNSTATGNISACEGSASAKPNIQQFTVSGSSLTANVTAGAPAGFEISLADDGGYSSNLTLEPVSGALSSRMIYVRSSANDPAGNISGAVVLTSAGAADQSVAVNGVVNALPTVNVVANQPVVSGTATAPVNFTGTATTFTWTNDTPGIGLAASGAGNISAFTAINNTTVPVTATIIVTPLNNTGCNGTPVKFTITVTPAPVSISASGILAPLATVYGTPSIAESFAVSGISITSGIVVSPPTGFELSSDGSNFSTSLTISGSGNISSVKVYIRLASTTPVGNYNGNIVLSTNGATSVNVIIPASAVTPAPLIITADNKTKPYGALNPILTVSYSGFVDKDGPAQLIRQPDVTTSAATQSAIGQYPIIASDAGSPNYTFTYIQGVLTITPSMSALFIPNTFTPNGDGINDTWNIKNLEYYPSASVNIFNRWGQQLFSSIGYPIPWDGKYNGKELPLGTYYYTIDPKNGRPVISGWVAIIR